MEARAFSEQTPLHWANFEGDHVEAARILLEESSDVVDMGATDGFTPLGFASQEGHLEIVKVLLQAGADVKVKCKRLLIY